MTTIEMWKNHSTMPEDLKTVLNNYSAEELSDAFYRRLEFGTAGMRGLLGAGINRMNIYTVGRANIGYGKYLLTLSERPKVAIAYDNRHYSKEFAVVCAQLLAKQGIESYVFDALRPTPELSFAVNELGCTGGIVITASHNPKEYNGYKVYDETGCQLTPDKIEQVIEFIEQGDDELSIDFEITTEQEKLIHWINREVDEPYVEKVLSIQLRPELEKKLKIVFTPQHGTAYPLLHQILTKAGYNVVLVKEQLEPNHDFINTKSPNPEEKVAYEKALEYAKETDADIVMTTDPDADRMGIVVKHQGEYVYFTGNQGGTVLLEYILSARQALNKLPQDAVIYNTIVTSDAGEKVAKLYGVATEKTLTGFKYIGEKIRLAKAAHSSTFLMGYEESYGYLLADFVRDKDALQSCLMLAEAANYYKLQGKTLVDVLNECFDKVGTHLEETVSITKTGEDGAAEIKAILATLREHPLTELAGYPVVYQEDYLKGERLSGGVKSVLDFPESDVLKFGLADGSWVAVRPSGTEPKCKFYYCIVGHKDEVVHKLNELKAAMSHIVKA